MMSLSPPAYLGHPFELLKAILDLPQGIGIGNFDCQQNLRDPTTYGFA